MNSNRPPKHIRCKANPLLGAPPFLRDYSWFCQMTPWIIGQSFESCVWNRVLTCRLVNGARIMNFQCIWNRTSRLQVFFSWIWPSILTVRIPDLSWDVETVQTAFCNYSPSMSVKNPHKSNLKMFWHSRSIVKIHNICTYVYIYISVYVHI